MINNYVNRGENRACQEVEDGYISANIFVKNLTIIPIKFYGTLLRNNKVTIFPTIKPEAFIKILQYCLGYV